MYKTRKCTKTKKYNKTSKRFHASYKGTFNNCNFMRFHAKNRHFKRTCTAKSIVSMISTKCPKVQVIMHSDEIHESTIACLRLPSISGKFFRDRLTAIILDHKLTNPKIRVTRFPRILASSLNLLDYFRNIAFCMYLFKNLIL